MLEVRRFSTRIIIYTTLLICLLIGGLIVVINDFVKENTEAQFISDIDTTVNNFIRVHRYPILIYDYYRIENVISEMLSIKNYYYVRIDYEVGEHIMVKAKDIPPVINQLAEEFKSQESVERHKFDGIEFITYQREIKINDRLWGYITIGQRTEAINNALRDANFFILKLALLSVLVGIVVAYFFSRHLTAPLDDLMLSVNQLTEKKNQTFATSARKDEFGNLSRAFGTLGKTIRSQLNLLELKNRELETHNRRLNDVININQKRAAELFESERKLQQAQKIAKLGFLEWVNEDKLFYVSILGIEILGLSANPDNHYSINEIDEKFDNTPQNNFHHLFAMIKDSNEDAIRKSFTLKREGKNIEIQLKKSADPHDKGFRIIGTLRDISDEIVAQETIRKLAYLDTLTQLPNRRQFISILTSIFPGSLKDGQRLSLLFIDVDKFKHINDEYGHSVGDQTIIFVGNHLKQALDRSNYQHIDEQATSLLSEEVLKQQNFDDNVTMLSRFGGDEFVALIRSSNAQQHQEFINKLREQLIVTLNIPDGPKKIIGLSCGIATLGEQTNDVDELVNHAAIALHFSKIKRDNRILQYSTTLKNQLQRNVRTEEELRMAIENNELLLRYQPKVSVVNNEICGVEALLRWNNSSYVDTPTTEIIEILEKIAIIDAVGDWVINEACAQLRRWRMQGIHLPMAVNVSPHQFKNGTIIKSLTRAMEQYQIEPHLLQIELTESSILDSNKSILRQLEKISNMGIKIYIDDFGTGYSSLSYLTTFKVDGIKVDRSLIKDIDQNSSDTTIAETAINLAKTLSKTVTVEGIENDAQLSFIQEMACDEYQGFLFYRPTTSAKVIELMSAQNARKRLTAVN